MKVCKRNSLKDPILIEKLFSEGSKIYGNNLLLVYFTHGNGIAVSCSKSNFKRAIDRNKIKRILRECLREIEGPTFTGMLIFKGNSIPEKETLINSLNGIYRKLSSVIDNGN